MNSNPLVSISCITFNQASYIRTCLDSFLMQQTSFDCEVVIHDDSSTDGTKEIIEEYTAKYPDIFFPMYQDKNQYSQGARGIMSRFNFPRCRGKYIALCEGDDYWTDPLKLQKQVGFLEKNKEYNYCGHKSSTNINELINKIPLEIIEFGFQELIFKNFLNTSTLLFRKRVINNLPIFFRKISAGDWALQLIAIKNSKGYVLPDYMSVYREHEKGVWSNLDNKTKCLLGVKTQEVFKLIYSDDESIAIIDRAIKKRKETFGIVEISMLDRIKSKLKKIYH